MGQNYGAITRCHATGDIVGNTTLGGLVGNNYSSISDCYAKRFVTSTTEGGFLGGLVGGSGADGTITRCFAAGLITGGNPSATGGIYGDWDGIVMNSFWDMETSGVSSNSGGTGLTTVEMQTESTFTSAGWDFVGETANGTDDIRTMPEGDYPKLTWQSVLDLPVRSPDFNGDGIVDSADVCIMVDHWGTDEPLCDIAPPPSGDGIIDVLDLILLSEHLFEDYRMVAHWKLDETEGIIAHDDIGGCEGTCYGEPLWQPADGKVIGALEFDGLDDYVGTDFVQKPEDGSFSAFAWIKGGSPGQVILSQVNRSVGRTVLFGSTWLGTDPSNGRLVTTLMDHPFGPLESQVIITDGQWHHIGLVYALDGLQRRLYVDGVEVAVDTAFVDGVLSDGGLYFGADNNLSATSLWFGLIDDIRIYPMALTAEEIAVLAQ